MNELLFIFHLVLFIRLVGFGFGLGLGFCGLARLPALLSIYPLILSSAVPADRLHTH
jgi:hypothetical protein